MPRLKVGEPQGLLRQTWSANVDDYAIAGGWILDGNALVVGDSAGGVVVFEGKSGDRSWSKRDIHDGGLLALAIHPEGTKFATSGQDGRVRLWNAATGEVEREIEVADDWVEHVAWAPDGRRLAVACSRRVHVYAMDGDELWRSEDHPSTVSAITWSVDGELATACYGRVSFFEADTLDLRQMLQWKGSLVSMVLSPDGDIVACGSQDKTVHFWRRSTSHDSMMSGYPGKPSALAFNDAGTHLATSGSDAITVWSFEDDGPEGTEPGILELHTRAVTSLAFAPRGMRLASGARDGGVVLWSLRRDGEGEPVGVAFLAEVVARLSWRGDGRALAALDAGGGVNVWRVINS